MEAIQWTDVASAVAASVAAIAALLTFAVLVAAGIVAWYQLNQMKTDGKRREREIQARLMADLSRRWEEPLLAEARQKAALQRNPQDLRDAVQNGHRAAAPDYYILIRVPNFFEDIAIMTRECSISEDIIRKSFAGTIKDTWYQWLPAVEYLRSQYGRDSIYEHFEWLNGKM